MIVTIDGPSGVGKTTIGIKITQKLNIKSNKIFFFLDTGIVYRIVALNIADTPNQVNDENLNSMDLDSINIDDLIEFENFKTPINYEEKYKFLYKEEIAIKTSKISQIPKIRELITNGIRKKVERIKLQQASGFIITGRDCGTVIFPNADYKFYLYASPQTRAQRRINQYKQLGKQADFNQILSQIIQRDEEDSKRNISPLPTIENLPPDFILIISDNLTIDQTTQKIMEYIKY
ncbi:MAG: (d)CMP kinase [Candidatus Calescibacterium sp.]|nr:(d)CMP kinase [Candidatus Calescibacterium sp.]MDW8133353.1 (d)CMP kinase [Candidatus Calescibacterium sp.]